MFNIKRAFIVAAIFTTFSFVLMSSAKKMLDIARYHKATNYLYIRDYDDFVETIKLTRIENRGSEFLMEISEINPIRKINTCWAIDKRQNCNGYNQPIDYIIKDSMENQKIIFNNKEFKLKEWSY